MEEYGIKGGLNLPYLGMETTSGYERIAALGCLNLPYLGMETWSVLRLC